MEAFGRQLFAEAHFEGWITSNMRPLARPTGALGVALMPFIGYMINSCCLVMMIKKTTTLEYIGLLFSASFGMVNAMEALKRGNTSVRLLALIGGMLTSQAILL
jgi:hypothetical protein